MLCNSWTSYCSRLWAVPPFWQSQLHQKKKSGKKFAVSTSCRPLGIWFTKSSFFSCTSPPEFLAVCSEPFVFLSERETFWWENKRCFIFDTFFLNFNVFENRCILVHVFYLFYRLCGKGQTACILMFWT